MEQVNHDLRRLEFILYRSMALLRRFSGDENVNTAILRIQRLIMTIRLLHTTINLLNVAAGPMGWAIAGLSAVATAVSIGDQLAMERAQY